MTGYDMYCMLDDAGLMEVGEELNKMVTIYQG